MASGSRSTEPGLLEGTSGSWTRRLLKPPPPALATLSFESLGHEDFQAFSLKRSNGPGAAKKVIGNIDGGTHIDVVCVNLRGWQD